MVRVYYMSNNLLDIFTVQDLDTCNTFGQLAKNHNDKLVILIFIHILISLL